MWFYAKTTESSKVSARDSIPRMSSFANIQSKFGNLCLLGESSKPEQSQPVQAFLSESNFYYSDVIPAAMGLGAQLAARVDPA